MRILVPALAFLCVATSAEAAFEKTCILAAAAKLPVIPGLTIQNSTAKSIAVPAATEQVLDDIAAGNNTIESLNAQMLFMDDKTNQTVRNFAGQNNYAAARDTLKNALTPKLTGANQVDIDVKAAGLDATYSAVCIWNAANAYVVTRPSVSK